jgi:hypothetical protein
MLERMAETSPHARVKAAAQVFIGRLSSLVLVVK